MRPALALNIHNIAQQILQPPLDILSYLCLFVYENCKHKNNRHVWNSDRKVLTRVTFERLQVGATGGYINRKNTGFRRRIINSTTTCPCGRIVIQLVLAKGAYAVNDKVRPDCSCSRLCSLCTNRSSCGSARDTKIAVRLCKPLSYRVSLQCRVTPPQVSGWTCCSGSGSWNRPHLWRRTSRNGSRSRSMSCVDVALPTGLT